MFRIGVLISLRRLRRSWHRLADRLRMLRSFRLLSLLSLLSPKCLLCFPRTFGLLRLLRQSGLLGAFRALRPLSLLGLCSALLCLLGLQRVSGPRILLDRLLGRRFRATLRIQIRLPGLASVLIPAIFLGFASGYYSWLVIPGLRNGLRRFSCLN